jgi:hypothetical protein
MAFGVLNRGYDSGLTFGRSWAGFSIAFAGAANQQRSQSPPALSSVSRCSDARGCGNLAATIVKSC